MTVIQALSAAFDPKAISWRAQSVSKKNPDAPKAMALAYIDARDVMARLDEAVGPENWQDSYVETALGRVLCTLSIRINGEWVSKSDGAGKTDIEGDKGGLSDAFKRAAVKWGIGRYLYDMPTPWVRCDLYNDKWSNWTADGLKELERVARGNSPTISGDTEPEAEVVSAEQRAIILGLCEAAGVPIGNVLKAAKIDDLGQLPADSFESVKKKLNLTIDKNTQAQDAQQRKAA